MNLKNISIVFLVLFGEYEIAVFVYWIFISAPQTIRWIARWKNDIKKAWQDEDPDYFK